MQFINGLEFLFYFVGVVTHYGNALLRTDVQKPRKRNPGARPVDSTFSSNSLIARSMRTFLNQRFVKRHGQENRLAMLGNERLFARFGMPNQIADAFSQIADSIKCP